MDVISLLPPVQAVLNMTAASLACVAYLFVLRGNLTLHRVLMASALLFSALFLVIYLYYHYQVGNIPFAGQGMIRPVYFALLVSHVFLAILMVPMILVTVRRALRGRLESHRRIARWTLSVWVYVSVTGVLIYLLAFQLYPPMPEHLG